MVIPESTLLIYKLHGSDTPGPQLYVIPEDELNYWHVDMPIADLHPIIEAAHGKVINCDEDTDEAMVLAVLIGSGEVEHLAGSKYQECFTGGFLTQGEWEKYKIEGPVVDNYISQVCCFEWA